MGKDTIIVENQLDIRKAYEALARIIGEREHVQITVTAIKKRSEAQKDEDSTA